jgi:hypothetical protein
MTLLHRLNWLLYRIRCIFGKHVWYRTSDFQFHILNKDTHKPERTGIGYSRMCMCCLKQEEIFSDEMDQN